MIVAGSKEDQKSYIDALEDGIKEKQELLKGDTLSND